jgi:tetratricopeptide (TPR) repeat protein
MTIRNAKNVLKFISLIMILGAIQVALFAQETDENDPVKIFNEAQTAHEKGDFESALKLYEKALEIIPEFPEAEYQRGSVLVSLRRPAEAERSFRHAIELRENWTLPMTSLGVLLLMNKKYDEAEELLTKSIELSGIDFIAYIALTELKIKTNAKPEVLRQLLAKMQVLTTKANSTASLWAARASLERTLGDKKAAIVSLGHAVSIDPLDTLALAERAELALEEGDLQRALIDAEKLKQITPNSESTDYLLARVFASQGEFEKSLQILDSFKNSSEEIKSFRDKVIAGGSTNVGQLETILETDKSNGAVLGRLCNLLRIDNPEKSLEYCRRASEAEPGNLVHAIGFGAALVQAKRYSEAIALFRRIISVAPDNYTAHTNLATALFQLQRFEEAKDEYHWVLKKEPNLPIAYYLLAISHDRLQEFVDAAANYQQFLRIADKSKNGLEIEKVNLRMPILQQMIKQGKGKKNE